MTSIYRTFLLVFTSKDGAKILHLRNWVATLPVLEKAVIYNFSSQFRPTVRATSKHGIPGFRSFAKDD